MNELLNVAADAVASVSGDSGGALAVFQWGTTVSGLVLLLVNRLGRRSVMQTNLLVLCLFTSFPTPLFNILRGEFGCWIAFLAVGANLYFLETCPVSRFILFVITPSLLADELRRGITCGIFCLLIGLFIVIEHIRGHTVRMNFECNLNFFTFCVAIGFLLFFTISYLFWENS